MRDYNVMNVTWINSTISTIKPGCGFSASMAIKSTLPNVSRKIAFNVRHVINSCSAHMAPLINQDSIKLGGTSTLSKAICPNKESQQCEIPMQAKEAAWKIHAGSMNHPNLNVKPILFN